MTVEELILQRIPGGSSERIDARLAILRIFHAAQNAEAEQSALADWCGYFVDDPVEGVHSGVLAENAMRSARTLRVLAGELDKSAVVLLRIRNSWQSFEEDGQKEGADGGGRSAADGERAVSGWEEPPF